VRWTIIICTFNRARDLAEALERLRRLSYPEDQFEIVVVDNASTDETPEVIGAASVKIRNLVSVREDIPGLSRARNKGIATARGEFVAFIDDDAWAAENWLSALDSGFNDEETACVGGKVEAVWPQDVPPSWLPERLYGFYSIVDYGERRFLHYPDYPAGTNIAFRKAIFQNVGYFNDKVGRIGESLLSMEEVDICLRMERAGFKVAYLPEAIVYHRINPGRTNEAWVRQRSRYQGISAALIETDRFAKSTIVAKSIKYSFFIIIGLLGHTVFTIIRNKKLAFFCANQVILCTAYLKQLFSMRQLSR
jgi:glucosyl-dolichyl phosphate glucuronosyltransferase